MAKKEQTPKQIVTRMLKTSRTFNTKDYETFKKVCEERIAIRKEKDIQIDALKAQQADILAKLKALGA